MKLPFTVGQFLQLFKDYNISVFPLQILLYILAAVIIFLSLKRMAWTDKITSSILALLWLWMGIVYHLLFFTTINKAAYLFGSLFIIQGILFIYYGVIKRRLSYRFQPNIVGWIGATFILFALVVYPLLGYLFGHVYPSAPTFGLPCPTTIFTFGVLLWSARKVPLFILLIPFLWCIIGFSAAIQLGMREDTALLIAGTSAVGILLFQKQGLLHADKKNSTRASTNR
jgi:hypothetical protein